MGLIHSLARRYGGTTYTQPPVFEGLGRAAGSVRRNQPSFLEGLSQRYTGPPNRNSFTEDMALRFCRPKEPHVEECPDCNGMGRVSEDETCDGCHGEGQLIAWQRDYEIRR